MNIKSFSFIINSLLVVSIGNSVSASWFSGSNSVSNPQAAQAPNSWWKLRASNSNQLNTGTSLPQEQQQQPQSQAPPNPAPLSSVDSAVSKPWYNFNIFNRKNVVSSPAQQQGINTDPITQGNGAQNNQAQFQEVQNIHIPSVSPVFVIREACSEAKDRVSFRNALIQYVKESDEDRNTARTKINDLLHCEQLELNLQPLIKTSEEEIFSKFNGNLKHLDFLIEAFEARARGIPRGSSQKGLNLIYRRCTKHLFNTMQGLYSNNRNEATKDLCENDSCTAQDLDKLKEIFMKKKSKSFFLWAIDDRYKFVVPSYCDHYSMKKQVYDVVEYFKAKYKLNENNNNTIPMDNLREEMIAIIKSKDSRYDRMVFGNILNFGEGKERIDADIRKSIENLVGAAKVYKVKMVELLENKKTETLLENRNNSQLLTGSTKQMTQQPQTFENQQFVQQQIQPGASLNNSMPPSPQFSQSQMTPNQQFSTSQMPPSTQQQSQDFTNQHVTPPPTGPLTGQPSVNP